MAALLGWLVVVALPSRRVTFTLGDTLTYFEATPQLKVLATILLLGLLTAVLWAEWRDRLVRRMRGEAEARPAAKPKRDPYARLALDERRLRSAGRRDLAGRRETQTIFR